MGSIFFIKWILIFVDKSFLQKFTEHTMHKGILYDFLLRISLLFLCFVLSKTQFMKLQLKLIISKQKSNGMAWDFMWYLC